MFAKIRFIGWTIAYSADSLCFETHLEEVPMLSLGKNRLDYFAIRMDPFVLHDSTPTGTHLVLWNQAI